MLEDKTLFYLHLCVSAPDNNLLSNICYLAHLIYVLEDKTLFYLHLCVSAPDNNLLSNIVIIENEKISYSTDKYVYNLLLFKKII